jgi:hypothetical protein
MAPDYPDNTNDIVAWVEKTEARLADCERRLASLEASSELHLVLPSEIER